MESQDGLQHTKLWIMDHMHLDNAGHFFGHRGADDRRNPNQVRFHVNSRAPKGYESDSIEGAFVAGPEKKGKFWEQ